MYFLAGSDNTSNAYAIFVKYSAFEGFIPKSFDG